MTVLQEISVWLKSPETTNNVAEYTAALIGVRAAAKLAQQLPVRRLVLQGDSELFMKHLDGSYKVGAKLAPLLNQVKLALAQSFAGRYKGRHVRREMNTHADALANRAMDSMCDWSRTNSAAIEELLASGALAGRRIVRAASSAGMDEGPAPATGPALMAVENDGLEACAEPVATLSAMTAERDLPLAAQGAATQPQHRRQRRRGDSRDFALELSPERGDGGAAGLAAGHDAEEAVSMQSELAFFARAAQSASGSPTSRSRAHDASSASEEDAGAVPIEQRAAGSPSAPDAVQAQDSPPDSPTPDDSAALRAPGESADRAPASSESAPSPLSLTAIHRLRLPELQRECSSRGLPADGPSLELRQQLRNAMRQLAN